MWHETEEPVSVEAIVANLQANAALARAAIRNLAAAFPRERPCDCANALQNAIITDLSAAPQEVKDRLSLLLGKYTE